MIANRKLSRLSLRCRIMLIVFAVITLPAELIGHSIVAREYYYLNVKNIQLVALTAAKTGAQFCRGIHQLLCEWPMHMRKVTESPAEVVFTDDLFDDHALTIRLDRKIPMYVAVLALGLPARDINVTTSASPQRAGHPFGTQILDVSAASRSRA